MSLNQLLSEPPPGTAPTVRRRAPIESIWTVTQRLGNAERELRVQFIRIAQMQAQLDLVLRALRRSSHRTRVR